MCYTLEYISYYIDSFCEILDLNIQFRLKCLVAPPIFSRIITFLPPLTPQKLIFLTKVKKN